MQSIYTMKNVFIYSNEFEKFAYDSSHPLQPLRFKLTYELAKSYGLFKSSQERVVKPKPCAVDDLLSVHSIDYIEAVEHYNPDMPEWDMQAYGLNTLDNPVFPQVYTWSLLSVGASLQATKLVESGEAEVAFNIGGGQHHAFRNRASGFCYFNDIAIAVQYLLDKGYRVAYVDIDAHHGDGVQSIFYRSDRVLTISLHQSGFYAFPGTGFEREIGEEEGEGYTVNIPLLQGSDDEVFYYAFYEIVPLLLRAFQPDVLLTQLGADSLRTDPLASLDVTTRGFCRVVEGLKELSPGKWIAFGGGGYDVFNVPRAWTLAWGIMNETELPDSLPRHYKKVLRKLGIIEEKKPRLPYEHLQDKHYQSDLKTKIHMLIELEKTINYIKNHQLALISGKS
ncbi:acetoin utilization protein AcuC [candidate division KSB3 bacterium]|uniref:Acetoin utilization protein AcuC n=1 Tax=candidate division KSB3 bacterium TaxID=2044937 RepID=A0A2G6E947_9BACT|nr:MAG: acetoin utilization protein AcuC [candidate division KSB3 bacterium]PIE29541.1 MAG: acetoin utilization protein AcuC [candidate division KSB3 bacterium]